MPHVLGQQEKDPGDGAGRDVGSRHPGQIRAGYGSGRDHRPAGDLGIAFVLHRRGAGSDSGRVRDPQIQPQAGRRRGGLRRRCRTTRFWTAITIKSRKKWKSSTDGPFSRRCPGRRHHSVYVLFVRAKDIPEAPAPSPTAHLEERKAQIYENLRDLQFEFRLGKLSDADYQKTKLDLQRELAKVLAEIDAMQPPPEPKPVQGRRPPSPSRIPWSRSRTNVPHCGAKFPQSMKFCGECGKAMAS